MNNSDQELWNRVGSGSKPMSATTSSTAGSRAWNSKRSRATPCRLSVPTRFLKSWVQSHYADRLLACWQDERHDRHADRAHGALRGAQAAAAEAEGAGGAASAQRPARDQRPAWTMPRAGGADLGRARRARRLAARSAADLRELRRRPLQHARACRRQAGGAGRGAATPVMFNPLYIHAGVGLGKTHLLQAIAWAGNATAERKVLYLTAEKFMYGFVAALRAQTALAFKEALRAHRRAGDRRPAVPAGQVDAGRVLPHAQRADRCRPPGGDRRRPAAVRARNASTSACARGSPAGWWSRWARSARSCGFEILKARVTAGAGASSRLRRAGAGAGLHRQDRHP